MARTATISVKVEPQLKKDLEIMASEEQRSLANLVNKILTEYVDAHLPPKKRR
jgi:predicted HicB family RNase H-like nuclease